MTATDHIVNMHAGPYEETENERDYRKGIWKQPQSILGIQASPRKTRGATEVIYSGFASGLKRGGAVVETIYLGDTNISPCIGCFRCWLDEKGACPLKDDMEAIIERLFTAEILVLATPLYMDGMSGLLKNFIDRLMPINHPSIFPREGRSLHPCCRSRMPNLVLVSVCGFYEKENFDPLVNQLSRFSVNMHMPLLAPILRPESLSMRSPEAASRVTEVTRAAQEAGEQILQEGRVSRELLDTISQPLLTREQYGILGKTWWRR